MSRRVSSAIFECNFKFGEILADVDNLPDHVLVTFERFIGSSKSFRQDGDRMS